MVGGYAFRAGLLTKYTCERKEPFVGACVLDLDVGTQTLDYSKRD
jgi:hypothetical protein